MKKTLIFTISARNYTGLACVLGSSVARWAPESDFRVYIAEDVPSGEASEFELVPAFQALAHIIPELELRNMAFMYNVTEFCTALKAASFIHAFEQGYERVIYLDPDTFLFNDIGELHRQLDSRSIVVTPHLCLPSMTEGPRADRGILATGVYNLGFIGMLNDAYARSFVDWWNARLRTQSFNDGYDALYTDQKWVDFLTCIVPGEAVKVWRHLGANMAPWNFHERQVIREDDIFHIRPRAGGDLTGAEPEADDRLVFVHFSGFDFKKICDGQFAQLNLDPVGFTADVELLYDRYGDAIRDRAAEVRGYLKFAYAHDYFHDGSVVLPSHRRLLRVHRARHGIVSDPFDCGPGTFHADLHARRLTASNGASDILSDKVTSRTISNSEGKRKAARRIFRILFRLLGRSRFFVLVRSLSQFARVEQHYDTFDLDGLRKPDRNKPVIGSGQ